MRIVVCIILLSLVSFLKASTREVVTVYLPLSFHDTDTAYPFEDQVIQAGVSPVTMVLSGAMPETLVAAVAQSHRLSVVGTAQAHENNLLAISQVKLEGSLEDKMLRMTLDVSSVTLPEEMELDIRTILKLSIRALQRTLAGYYSSSDLEQRYRIDIIGTTEKNASLKKLSMRGVIGKL